MITLEVAHHALMRSRSDTKHETSLLQVLFL